MHRFISAFILLAIPGLLILACEGSATQPTQSSQVWHGLLKNDCGPRDERIVLAMLDSLEYPDCVTRHPNQFTARSELPDIDSIPDGAILTGEQLFKCPGGNAECIGTMELRLEIMEADENHAKVAFRIRTWSPGSDTTSNSGTAILKKCRERPFCG